MPDDESVQVLGTGVYDLYTAEHLLNLTARRLRGWARADRRGNPPLLTPTHGWAYSFYDLISLGVIGVLHSRGVSRAGIYRTIQICAEDVGTTRPFAHRDVVEMLGTIDQSVFRDDGEAVADLTRGGQLVIPEFVRGSLLPVEYGSNLLARLVRPHERVLVDPAIQVGHPCVEGTRVTTDVIVDRVTAGETLELVAGDLQLDLDDAVAAVAFERNLVSGGSILAPPAAA